MEINANLRAEDVIKGYIWLVTAPNNVSHINLKNSDIKSRTSYYDYIESIEWSEKERLYVMKLNPEGQAKWNEEYKRMAEWIGKNGCE